MNLATYKNVYNINMNMVSSEVPHATFEPGNLFNFLISDDPSTGNKWSVIDHQCGPKFQQAASNFNSPNSNFILNGRVTRVFTFDTNGSYTHGSKCDLTFVNSNGDSVIGMKHFNITLS